MPPKRGRPPGPTAARRVSSQTNSQSTLSFHGKPSKVTKPTSAAAAAAKGTKGASNKTKIDPALLESIVSTNLPAVASPDPSEPTTAELSIAQQTATPKGNLTKPPASRTPEEDAASKISDAAISRYWRTKESSRKAPRVHQEKLSLSEKILREFDTSGAYGPCIGISRTLRWKRAHELGLKPPLEVLAVLMREQEKGSPRERAEMDGLMSSRFVET
ncbi:hypothetical protein H2201_000435 [Coniosporium apollinis]|uniref:DNA polymerase delta subunit 4 n=1 Tax=Coniosporium apollinis TaxID=61459 RepID=A0ABQ9P5I2_9PEZI|nr:hypothetical protein H2201_000435 [Coniosporium apollinis]